MVPDGNCSLSASFPHSCLWARLPVGLHVPWCTIVMELPMTYFGSSTRRQTAGQSPAAGSQHINKNEGIRHSNYSGSWGRCRFMSSWPEIKHFSSLQQTEKFWIGSAALEMKHFFQIFLTEKWKMSAKSKFSCGCIKKNSMGKSLTSSNLHRPRVHTNQSVLNTQPLKTLPKLASTSANFGHNLCSSFSPFIKWAYYCLSISPESSEDK